MPSVELESDALGVSGASWGEYSLLRVSEASSQIERLLREASTLWVSQPNTASTAGGPAYVSLAVPDTDSGKVLNRRRLTLGLGAPDGGASASSAVVSTISSLATPASSFWMKKLGHLSMGYAPGTDRVAGSAISVAPLVKSSFPSGVSDSSIAANDLLEFCSSASRSKIIVDASSPLVGGASIVMKGASPAGLV